MSKQTRQQKKEEEKRIIAEMEDALREARGESVEETPPEASGKKSVYATEPDKIHCRRCKTLMENGVCPTCGFKMYVPMSEEKRKKIKMVATAIGFAVFIAIFLIIQFTKN